MIFSNKDILSVSLNSSALNNHTSLNCVVLLIRDLREIQYSAVDVFSVPYDFLNIFCSLTYFIIRIQYKIHIRYKIHVNRLFMLSVKAMVNSCLKLVKFWGNQKLHKDF